MLLRRFEIFWKRHYKHLSIKQDQIKNGDQTQAGNRIDNRPLA